MSMLLSSHISQGISSPVNPEEKENCKRSFECSEKQINEYTEHKRDTFKLAITYSQTNLPLKENIVYNLRRCGQFLEFAREKSTGIMHLVGGLFCQKRLCPLCSYRRSRKNFFQIWQVITQPDFKNMHWVFLTFTIRNCKGEELGDTIDRLHNAFRGMTKDNTRFRRSFLGWFRCTEVTYNARENTYHPHIHVLACVDDDYYTNKSKYFDNSSRRRELSILWTKALNRAVGKRNNERIMHGGHRNQDIAIYRCERSFVFEPFQIVKDGHTRKVIIEKSDLQFCTIEAVDDGLSGKDLAEVAKYTVKSIDYVDRPNVLETLHRSLDRKRCSAFGGLMKTVHQRLNLDDSEDDILDDTPSIREGYLNNPDFAICILRWNVGAKVYDVVEQEADGKQSGQSNFLDTINFRV